MILVRPTQTTEYLSIIARYKNNPQPFLGVGVTSQLTVYNTGRNDLDLEACERHNAIVIPYVSNGGTAISNVGDISVYFGIQGNHAKWCEYVRADIKRWLAVQGINAHEEKNDLVIDEKKVLGYTGHPGLTYSCGSIFIAMNNSQDLVNEICKKPKTRKTAGLNDYGISANEISEVIIQSTKNYLNSIGVKEGGK